MDGDYPTRNYSAAPTDEYANTYAWVEIENYARRGRGKPPMNTGERDAKQMELLERRLNEIPDSEFNYSKIADGIYPERTLASFEEPYKSPYYEETGGGSDCADWRFSD